MTAPEKVASLAFGLRPTQSVRIDLTIREPSTYIPVYGIGTACSICFTTQAGVQSLPNNRHPAARLETDRTLSFRQRLRAVLTPPATTSALAWAEPLFPFQQEGVAALLGHPCLLLADDMGLGKTVQAIAALRLLRVDGPLRALVVVPAGLTAQWRGAFRVWAPELTISGVRGSAADRGMEMECAGRRLSCEL